MPRLTRHTTVDQFNIWWNEEWNNMARLQLALRWLRTITPQRVQQLVTQPQAVAAMESDDTRTSPDVREYAQLISVGVAMVTARMRALGAMGR
jgi:hypothetical protein